MLDNSQAETEETGSPDPISKSTALNWWGIASPRGWKNGETFQNIPKGPSCLIHSPFPGGLHTSLVTVQFTQLFAKWLWWSHSPYQFQRLGSNYSSWWERWRIFWHWTKKSYCNPLVSVRYRCPLGLFCGGYESGTLLERYSRSYF